MMRMHSTGDTNANAAAAAGRPSPRYSRTHPAEAQGFHRDLDGCSSPSPSTSLSMGRRQQGVARLVSRAGPSGHGQAQAPERVKEGPHEPMMAPAAAPAAQHDGGALVADVEDAADVAAAQQDSEQEDSVAAALADADEEDNPHTWNYGPSVDVWSLGVLAYELVGWGGGARRAWRALLCVCCPAASGRVMAPSALLGSMVPPCAG